MSLALFQSKKKVKADKTEELEQQFPNIRIHKNPRAKRMTLRLDQKDRQFVLSVPKRFSRIKAKLFLKEHQTWMNEKLSELPESIKFTHGTVIPLYGIDHTIIVHYDSAAKRTTCTLTGDKLIVKTNKDDPSARITRFLKDHAKTEFTALSKEKATRIGKPIKDVSIRDTKSRWGSCSASGSLSLSWRLIFAPYHAMDYVIAHEVAHLEHLNHGKSFWKLCAKLSDDYKNGHRWMKEHGHTLMRFG